MMQGNPCGHYVAVVPDDVEKVSAGGIVLAEDFDVNKKNRVEAGSTRGTVLAIGKMAWKAYDGNDPDWKPWTKVGSTVWFQRHAAKIIEDESEKDKDGNPRKIFIMADENILWDEGVIGES